MPDATLNLEETQQSDLTVQTVATSVAADTPRKRAKPGERKEQILQTLASMLEQPNGERITTAALAGRLGVSEAALYRHFASKAQMFEGLIEFIEHSIFSLINQILDREQSMAHHSAAQRGARQAAGVISMLIQFAEKNPGMARVMVGDALVFENERLQQRMNHLFDKVEAALKQCLRDGAAASSLPNSGSDAQVRSAVLVAFVTGRLQRFVRTGYRRVPSESLDASLAVMLG